MNDQPRKPLQFGLKWLFLLPAAAGIVIALYTAGLPADVLFFLLAVPAILLLWLALSRLASRFLADWFD
jgi:hypothetical protein